MAWSARSLAASSAAGTLDGAWACYEHPLTENDSYKLAAIKLVTPTQEHLEKHYEDLKDKPFFKGLITCSLSCND